MVQRFDYIVIGSGFGGSVSAMRLSEKGYNVAVLEKGKKYEAKDFPQTNWDVRKYLWAPLVRCFGFQKLTLFKEAFILSGVGVGGGSLVYANTLMQPERKFYHHKIWANLNDWENILPKFYDTARYMLGVAPNPYMNVADNILESVAKEMGRGDTFKNVNVGVYFGDTQKAIDPYFGGEGPLRTGCTQCAGCMVGCRFGAKNTLDKNYLWFAQKFGAKIFAETLVDKIEYINGEYHITTQKSTAFFKWKKQKFVSKGIVVSGGVLGTMDILFKQKYKYKTLPNLSDKLGQNLLTNSESLCGITNIPYKVNHGIAISSIFDADDNTHVEIVKFPDGSNAMKLLSTIATGQGSGIIRVIKMIWNIIRNPITYLKMMLNPKWATNTIILLVMQSLENSMRMSYSKIFGLKIVNDGDVKVPAYIDKGQEVMYRYAKQSCGVAANALTEVMFNTSTTAHIMGGCPMGQSAEDGVVNNKFQAFGYPDMYILDGSIIPCNLGVNPSLTITALSEYAMSNIPVKA